MPGKSAAFLVFSHLPASIIYQFAESTVVSFLKASPRVINGAEADQSHPDYVGTPAGHPPLTSFLGVPLLEGGKPIGLIALANKEGGYSPIDQEYIERLGTVIVMAVHRKQTDLAVRQLNEELVLSNKELREARDRANRASKLKSEFLANMSHEIRTPLNGIIGMIELLKRKDPDSEYRHYLDNISEAGDSLLAVVNDVLDFWNKSSSFGWRRFLSKLSD